MKQTVEMDVSEFEAIWKEVEGYVDKVIMAMETGDTAFSGVLDWDFSLDEESQFQFKGESQSMDELGEQDNTRLQKEVGRCQGDDDETRKLQSETVDQLKAIVKSKMLEYLKTSIDKLQATENSEKEQLRGELHSVQRKVLELEAAWDDAQREAEVKAGAMAGKDTLIQDLSSKVGSLAQSLEEKSREVDQLKDELNRMKLTGHHKRIRMGEPLQGDPATPLAGEANGTDPGERTSPQVKATEGPGARESTVVDDNDLGGASSDLPSSDNPSRVYELWKRNSRQVSCNPEVSPSPSKSEKRPISNQRIWASIFNSPKAAANRNRHAEDPARPLQQQKQQDHLKNLASYRLSMKSTQQHASLALGEDDRRDMEHEGSSCPTLPDNQERGVGETSVSTLTSLDDFTATTLDGEICEDIIRTQG